MLVKRHFLHVDDDTRVPYERSPNQSGKVDPRFLIMHYTAASSARSAIDHLVKPASKASAHLVIGRDGAITQLVPFDRIAWHAGKSHWMNLEGLNAHSIGIELDNAGELRDEPTGWTAWFGRKYPETEVVIATHQFDAEPSGWHDFPEVQIAAALEAAAAIVSQYGIKEVLGHDDIAPGRKRDPGPAFPMGSFRAKLLGRMDEEPYLVATTTALNLRAGPGVDYDKLTATPLAPDTRLSVESRSGSWFYVEVLTAAGTPDQTGWVYGNYLAPV